jgi:hypothetical protein
MLVSSIRAKIKKFGWIYSYAKCKTLYVVLETPCKLSIEKHKMSQKTMKCL